MYVVIALVIAQRARTAPTTVTATLSDGLRSSRCRLWPRRVVASAGMTLEKCCMSDEIVSGPTTSVNVPTTTSRTDGIAKNVEYASAEASIVPLSARSRFTARTKDPAPVAQREVT